MASRTAGRTRRASRGRRPRPTGTGGEWDIFGLNRETSDTELDAWGRQYIPGFLGVCSRTEFADIYPGGAPMEPGSSCIVNLDPGYAHGGSHWVGVRVARDAPLLLYFDSFGLPPPREVSLRGRREGRGTQERARGTIYSDIRYQQYPEVNCGPRALAALHYLATAPDELEAFAELGQKD